jgi:hypothetical protein
MMRGDRDAEFQAVACLLLQKELSPASIDWEAVYRLARAHAIGPLLHSKLSTHPNADRVDAQVRAAWRDEYRFTAVRNAILVREAMGIGRKLTAAGIPHVFFKGIALIGSSYKDQATRVLSDIDLFVPLEHMDHVVDVLSAAAYRATSDHPVPTARELGEVSFVSSGNWTRELAPAVDVHVSLDYLRLHRAAPASDRFDWTTTGPVERSADSLSVLNAETHMVMIVLHLLSHLRFDFTIKWYWDIIAIVQSHSIDWCEVERLLRRHEGLNGGWLVFETLRRDFDINVPPEFLDRIRPSRLVGTLRRPLHTSKLLRRGRVFRSGIMGIGWRLAVDDAPASRIAAMLRIVFPPVPWLRARYADSGNVSAPRLWWTHAKRLIFRVRTNFASP